MKRNILYVLYEDNKTKENSQKDWQTVSNDRYIITVCRINPYKFIGFCGQRCHELYVDAEFQKSKIGQEIINEVFKPMCCFKDSYFSFI